MHYTKELTEVLDVILEYHKDMIEAGMVKGYGTGEVGGNPAEYFNKAEAARDIMSMVCNRIKDPQHKERLRAALGAKIDALKQAMFFNAKIYREGGDE